MDRKEAETSLKNDWYINNGNLIVEHDKVNRFLEACGMGIKALHEPEHRCENCGNAEDAGVRIYCLLHTSFHRLDEYCSEWEAKEK